MIIMSSNIKKVLTLIIILLIILIGLVTYFGKDYLFSFRDEPKKGNEEKEEEKKEPEKVVEVKKLKIIDLESKSRPISVMIDNIKSAWPQAGLNDAYLVYEIIVEGGQTRLLALFKDKDTAMIGPVRSSRHYYLDYALENDAIYAHFGWSPQAQRDISALSIPNLNGMTNAGGAYWRSDDAIAPHNVFTSIAKLEQSAKSSGYREETNKDTLLNYSVDEINLNSEENAKVAGTININYSSSHVTSYVYNAVTKLYSRSMLGIAHTDKVTKQQYTVKNIIVINVNNYADPDNYDKGRQTLANVGEGAGHYITNGYAIPITWKKDARSSQTVYKNIKGEEIKINDGNTYIQIQPLNQTLIIQ